MDHISVHTLGIVLGRWLDTVQGLANSGEGPPHDTTLKLGTVDTLIVSTICCPVSCSYCVVDFFNQKFTSLIVTSGCFPLQSLLDVPGGLHIVAVGSVWKSFELLKAGKPNHSLWLPFGWHCLSLSHRSRSKATLLLFWWFKLVPLELYASQRFLFFCFVF